MKNTNEFAEYTPEQLARVVRSIFGTLPVSTMEKLAEAELEIARANMHYGLNAQVDANVKMSDMINEAVNNLSDFSRKELSKKIDCAINNKEYTL